MYKHLQLGGILFKKTEGPVKGFNNIQKKKKKVLYLNNIPG